ncbi:transposase-like protein DUF772 [Breznakia blatticola]|uniref:Transposase-like protein DUF772 n=1 Tax=Breznakia blatticola TaxID=1754012 RepID=A0A4R8A4R6_9FIRM|nr:transposase [Breznakia blatticola]TDW25325.1 transposase-like protein DUF772 [Breznakia blatticola]
MQTIVPQEQPKSLLIPEEKSLLKKFRMQHTQMDIFECLDLEVSDDFLRLEYCFKGLDVSTLVTSLNRERGKGRNDYPNEVMLNLALAKIVLGHNSTASFIRELNRNRDLRKICGLRDIDYIDGIKKKVPGEAVFTRFYQRLENYQEELDSIQKNLVEYFYENVDGFGEKLAGDGKYIQSYANRVNEHADGERRSENDASVSIKENFITDKNGKEKIKKHSFFGFRAHVIVDVLTGLPINVHIDKANISERMVMKEMVEELSHKPKYLMLDKGYDGKELFNQARGLGIRPIVDARKMRKDEDGTQYKDTNIYYYENGDIYYANPETGKADSMKYLGYDKTRKAMRYEHNGKVYRLYLKDDERIFNEVARGSKKFKRLYKGRTAVERYNARLDCDYGFEHHYLRNLDTIRVRVQLANLVMLSMAKTHVEKKQTNYMSMYNFN